MLPRGTNSIAKQLNVALVHDYLNQRGGAERVFAHYRPSVARRADLYRALRRARRRRSRPARPRAPSYLARIPFREPLLSRCSRRSIREHSKRSTSAGSIRSSVRRRRGQRACCVPPGAVHVCYINTVSRFAFAYDDVRRRFRAVRAVRVRGDAPGRLGSAGGASARRASSRTRATSPSASGAYYGRDADVLHCPVDLDRFTVGSGERRLLCRSRRGCCRTSASISRFAPRRWPASRC